MGFYSGWLAALTIVLAAGVPLVQRAVNRKRARLDSPATRGHVLLGLATVTFAFLHTLLMLPSLGTESAVEGGMAALAPGGLAFFALAAHGGIGLALRREKLRDRVSKRRTHLATGLLIVALVSTHAFLLERASGR
jgi:hypothetical protein